MKLLNPGIHVQDLKTYLLRDDGLFPNNPRWPLLIYPAAVAVGSSDPAAVLARTFEAHGWQGIWRNGIYDFPHYHSTTHEVLGVFSGHGRVQFGGPQGVDLELRSGDVAVLPAGTAHQRLTGSSDFRVVGAYPPAAKYDLCRGTPEERTQALANIRQVAKPESDPVYGLNGGLCEYWVE